MKYLLLALGIISTSAHAEVKYLHYKFNQNVIITISNADCPIVGLKDKYSKAAMASRIDGAKLIGCYKKLDENLIEIGWYKGDTTVIPANAFLVNPELGNKAKPDTSEKTAI